MNKFPLVSIAVCIFNGEKHLCLQLDSIFKQDYKNIEVIAIDDCSTDTSPSILESYAKKFPHLKIYRNETNLGYVKNFEKAINLCSGQYIALSDQDDIWHKEKISKQVAEIGDHILIYHDSEFIDEDGKSMNQKMSDILNLYEGSSPLPFVFMNSVSGHTILFNRSLIQYALPFNQSFFHDWWLAFVACNVGSIKLIDYPLVQYRQHKNSVIDILGIKELPQQQQNNELLTKKSWVDFCSKFQGTYTKYLKSIHLLIYQNLTLYEKIKLYLLIYNNRKLFHFISKTPINKQSSVIRKLVFSLNDASS